MKEGPVRRGRRWETGRCDGRGAHNSHGSRAGRSIFGCVLCVCLCSLPLPLSTASGGGEPGRWLSSEVVRLRGGQQHSEVLNDGEKILQCSNTGCTCSGSCSDARGVGAGSRVAQASRDNAQHPHEHMWQQDVGERYKQLVPPRHPSRHNRHMAVQSLSPQTAESQAADIRDAVAKASLASQLPRKCVEEVNMFLDLDKAAIWGNDGNDFGIALQWMERPFDDVLTLYKHLLNPYVKQTYRALAARANKVRVVIYTMRSSLLLYHSCFREAQAAMVPLQWNPKWHINGQLYLPAELATSEEIMAQSQWAQELLEAERLDMRNALERLLAVREVIRQELALSERPLVVVSAERKNVMLTAKALDLDVDTCYLWDDNTKFAPQDNVVRVAPYIAMPEARRAELLRFMYRSLPPCELDPDLVDFLLDAPAPDSALVQQPSGELDYHVACATHLEPWALPRTGVWAQVAEADASACSARQTPTHAWSGPMPTRKDAEVEESAPGTLSPVTPPDADAPGLTGARCRPREAGGGGGSYPQNPGPLPALRVARVAGQPQGGSDSHLSSPGAGIYRVFTGPSC